MATHTFFLYLLTILLAARVMAEIAVRLNFPSVIGELMAGVILGPSLLGWLEPNEVLKLLAEIGIILLLFQLVWKLISSVWQILVKNLLLLLSVGLLFPLL